MGGFTQKGLLYVQNMLIFPLVVSCEVKINFTCVKFRSELGSTYFRIHFISRMFTLATSLTICRY